MSGVQHYRYSEKWGWNQVLTNVHPKLSNRIWTLQVKTLIRTETQRLVAIGSAPRCTVCLESHTGRVMSECGHMTSHNHPKAYDDTFHFTLRSRNVWVHSLMTSPDSPLQVRLSTQAISRTRVLNSMWITWFQIVAVLQSIDYLHIWCFNVACVKNLQVSCACSSKKHPGAAEIGSLQA